MRWFGAGFVCSLGYLAGCGEASTDGVEASGGSAAASGGSFGDGSGGAGGTVGEPASGGAPGSGGFPAQTGGAASGGQTSSGGAPAFDPCPRDEACKILPLGDSITFGLAGSGGGYRVALFSAARGAGKNITFVGSQANGPTTVAGETFPRSHDGYSGYTIQQIADMIPDKLSPNPHIVLLHLGTNDMYQGPQGAPERLGALIDEITTELPGTLVVVSSIIPFPASASAVEAYNAAIPGLVEQRRAAGGHVLFVDQFSGFPTAELGDGVHPSDAGYARMGRVWYEAIEGFLH